MTRTNTVTASGWLTGVATTELNPDVRRAAQEVAALVRGYKQKVDAAVRAFKLLSESLAPLCVCAVDVGPDDAPPTACPLHSAKRFINEVQELRRLRYRAEKLAEVGPPAGRVAVRRVLGRMP